MTRAAQLARAAVFAALDAEALRTLAARSVPRSLRRGRVLWRHGDREDAAAVVVTGRLDVTRVTEDGERMILRGLGPGEVVGLSVVAGEPHSADLAAGETTELLIVPGAALRAVFRDRPELALTAIARLGARLAELTGELEELRFLDLDERLRRRITRLGAGRREVSLTHAELAELVGATRANVSRALARLERRGVLRRRRGRIEMV